MEVEEELEYRSRKECNIRGGQQSNYYGMKDEEVYVVALGIWSALEAHYLTKHRRVARVWILRYYGMSVDAALGFMKKSVFLVKHGSDVSLCKWDIDKDVW